jgi:general secretion pathway protein F
MPEFAWRAVSASGTVVHGQSSAATPALVLRQLQQQGLMPLAIEDRGDAPGGDAAAAGRLARPAGARAAKGPVRAADVLALTSELSIMLRAGLALDKALRVLIDMDHRASVSHLLQQVTQAVKGGAPLSRALAQHPRAFGDFYVNMVRSGEASGQMSAVLERLVEHMERQRALRDSVVSATIYPAILLVVALLSVVGMLGFVVPQFEQLFADMGDALPLPTRVIVQLAHLFTDYGVFLGLFLLAAGWAGARWLRSAAGAAWWRRALLRLPLVGPLAFQYEMTLFARSLGTLLTNGVPLLAALQVATQTVGNPALRQTLGRLPVLVKEGGRFAKAAESSGVFAPLAINLIRVGEETGRVGPMVLELASILNREVETGIKRLLTLVEPVLILLLGVLIAAIIVSILLGILSVNDLAL